MKKFIAILILFAVSGVFAEGAVDFMVPAGYIPSESGIDLKAFQVIGLSNGSFVGNSVRVEGSLVSRDYSQYPAVAILARIDGTDVAKYPLSSPGFSFDCDLAGIGFGAHRLELYAIGRGSDEHTDPIERLFGATVIEVVKVPQMTIGGWIFMSWAWAFIIFLNVFLFAKIFGIKKSKIVEPLEIDTGDK